MFNKCKETENLIFDYIDKILPARKEKIVLKHLETCDKCNLVYQEYLELKEQLCSVQLEELPENFEKELHIRLVQENDSKHKSRIWIPVVSTAVTAALAAIVIFNAELPDENQQIVYNQPSVASIEKSGMNTNDEMFYVASENLKAEPTGIYIVELNNNELIEQLKKSYQLNKDGEYYIIDCTKDQFEEINLILLQNNYKLIFKENSNELKIKIKK